MANIKLGYVPTRRSIFSAPDAIKFRGLTAGRLRELGVDFVDIDDINSEGLLYSEDDRLKVLEKFWAEKVDGLLLAHCNFGTEYVCARPGIWAFLSCSGVPWTNGLSQMVSACGTPSAACSPPARCCADSRSLSPTSPTAGSTTRCSSGA